MAGYKKSPRTIKTSEQLDKEKRERYKKWITFFRLNPHIFIEDYFGIRLYPYQKLVIWMLQRSNLFYWVAARAAAKSFLIGIWALTLAVLYPGIKVIVASKTLKQAGIIVTEKIKALQKDYPNVAREIEKLTDNSNTYEVIFHNGSTIKASVSTENARGQRCNYLILDESRLVPQDVLDSVLRPFLFSRKPPYMQNPKYGTRPELKEEGIISYITSAGFKSEYWFNMVKRTIKRVVDGDETANFLAMDYLITTYHNIKTEEMIRNESTDMDSLTKQMEYLNIPAGSSGKAYFKMSMFNRVMRRAFYPQRVETYNQKRNPYAIDKVAGEIRMVSVDIATRAGKANDNTIISCARLIPMMGRGYKRMLVYMESHKGINTLVQAKRIKQIFFDFEADWLVLDLKNAGISIFDSLSQTTIDEERGVDYPAMTVADSEFIDEKVKEELVDRTLGAEPIEVVFPISATGLLNSQIAVAFRSSLQKHLWEFLITDMEGEEFLLETNKDYVSNLDNSELRAFYMSPYVQTNLMINESVNLNMKLLSGNIKLEESEGAYKDRYTSVSYLNWIASFFDLDILKQDDNKSDLEAMASVLQFVN